MSKPLKALISKGETVELLGIFNGHRFLEVTREVEKIVDGETVTVEKVRRIPAGWADDSCETVVVVEIGTRKQKPWEVETAGDVEIVDDLPTRTWSASPDIPRYMAHVKQTAEDAREIAVSEIQLIAILSARSELSKLPVEMQNDAQKTFLSQAANLELWLLAVEANARSLITAAIESQTFSDPIYIDAPPLPDVFALQAPTE